MPDLPSALAWLLEDLPGRGVAGVFIPLQRGAISDVQISALLVCWLDRDLAHGAERQRFPLWGLPAGDLVAAQPVVLLAQLLRGDRTHSIAVLFRGFEPNRYGNLVTVSTMQTLHDDVYQGRVCNGDLICLSVVVGGLERGAVLAMVSILNPVPPTIGGLNIEVRPQV